MEITTEIITDKFREYNQLYFGGELPLPKILLRKSFYICGYFSCKKPKGRQRLKGQCLEVSSYYDWDEEALRDIMVHEMIHYYLAYKHIDNLLTHGEAFQSMSENLNERFGLHISKRVNGNGFKRAASAPKIGFFLSKIFG